MEFEEEAPSLKEKITKFIVFIFISLLTIMLISTFIQGDSEKFFLQIFSGKDKTIAGKIAGDSIPQDYFQAAKLECNYMFKQRFPSLADDTSTLNNCAFNRIKIQKIDRFIGDSVGFSVSDLSIKQEISDEARRIHKETKVSAGYSSEEIRSVDDIYKAILNSVPMNYRKDSILSERLADGFLYSDIKETEDEKKIQNEFKSFKISISYISFSDDDLSKLIGIDFPVSEDEIKKDYDDSVKNKSLPLGADAKPISLESRKAFILNKLRDEKKEKKISELKAKILSTKSEANATLSVISTLSNSKIIDLNQIPFSSIEAKNPKSTLPVFLTTSAFLKEMTKTPFGKGRIIGPFTDKNQTFYVDLKDVKFDSNIPAEKTVSQDPNQNRVRTFLYEIKQSLSGNYPIERSIDSSAQATAE